MLHTSLLPSCCTRRSWRFEQIGFPRSQVEEAEIDDRALAKLSEFDSEQALEALDQFCKCDLSKVRKKSAYLIGVMQRIKKADPDWPRRSPTGQNGAGPNLPVEVSARLQMMFEEGVCRPSDLDRQCLSQLARLPVPMALEALNEFSRRDLSDVRNFSALFVSILRRLESDFDRGGAGAPPQGGMPHMMAPPAQMPPPVGMNRMGMVDSVQGQFQMPGQVPQYPMAMPGQMPSTMPFNPMDPQVVMTPGLAPMPGMPGQYMGAPESDRHNYGMEQLQMGVRVDEFHKLSPHATYVHPAPSLKLQTLWDEGVRLVSVLDDGAWDALAQLKAPEALAVIEDVANKLQGPNNLRNVNAFFMSVARKFLPQGPRSAAAAGPGAYPPTGQTRVVRQSPRGVAGDLSSLSPDIRQKIDDVVYTHQSYIKQTDFDQ
eukprot:evm.model.scf_4266.1 EVM.evm.TU.scf_4266.1   scf_4266:598-4927(-)